MVRAATFSARGSMVMQPPVSHKEAQSEYGATISESAWEEICDAFRHHGRRLSELEVTRDNQNTNDARGWRKRKLDAERGVEAALAGLFKINPDFLAEAAYNVALKRSGGLETFGEVQRLQRAIDEVLFLSLLIRDAEPLSRVIPTETECRKMLARDVFAALKSAGASLSNGWEVARNEPSYADLTGFERLAEVLEIHQGVTPRATAKWLRDAVGTR